MSNSSNNLNGHQTENIGKNYLGSAKPQKLQIASVTWKSEDLRMELENILQGSCAQNIKEKLVNYIIENIEPAGWEAIWRPCGQSKPSITKSLEPDFDYLVDVMHVSQENLSATVVVKKIVQDGNILTQSEILQENECTAPLIELWPLANQENDALDINTTIEVIEQVRFFMNNIWQPWDSFEEVCYYDKNLLSIRMQIYDDMEQGAIPRIISSEMNSLKKKAEETAQQIHNLEMKSGIASVTEVDQRDIVLLMKLNKEIEQLKTRFDSLRDPASRELILHQEQLERRDILASLSSDKISNILVVVDAVSLGEFMLSIQKLPNLLDSFPQSKDISILKTFPTLQMALDSSKLGDVVCLLPGTHLLRNLGAIAKGGVLCGLGPNVDIIGCLATGDIFLDVEVIENQCFILHSVTLKPLEEQIAITLHGGRMMIQESCIKGGTVGVSLIKDSKCRVEKVVVTGSAKAGIECKSNSEVVFNQTTIQNCCRTAVKAEEGTKVTFLEGNGIVNCPRGIVFSSNFCLPEVYEKMSDDINEIKKKIVTGDAGIKFDNTEEKFALILEQ